MSAALETLAELVRRESGLALGEAGMPALAAAARRAAPGMDTAELVRALQDPDQDLAFLTRLIDEVTVNETFFFRHRRDLDELDWPGLLRSARAAKREEIRVWSAACASGEEAYTLAILASEAFRTRTPPVSVLGTDISHAAVDGARAGNYSARSVAGVRADLRERYFGPDGHSVDAQLRAHVRFERHNLVSDPVPGPGDGGFDLVVCRNVLIYFAPVPGARVVATLKRALSTSGKLVLGSADRLCDWAVHDDAPKPQLPPPAPRPTRARRPTPAPTLEGAMEAADAGRLDEAVTAVEKVLAANPLDARAQYVLGIAKLAGGDGAAAVAALRKSLYLEPRSPLASFKLGRAHDSLHQPLAAMRAYAATLRLLGQVAPEDSAGLDAADLTDLAAATRARLASLRRAGA